MMYYPPGDAFLTCVQEGRVATVTLTASDDVNVSVQTIRERLSPLGITPRITLGTDRSLQVVARDSERRRRVAPKTYFRQRDQGAKSGGVVLTHSDPGKPVIHVLDGITADTTAHHTPETEELAERILKVCQEWDS
jgi:hypothetical protein